MRKESQVLITSEYVERTGKDRTGKDRKGKDGKGKGRTEKGRKGKRRGASLYLTSVT